MEKFIGSFIRLTLSSDNALCNFSENKDYPYISPASPTIAYQTLFWFIKNFLIRNLTIYIYNPKILSLILK